MHAAVYNHVRQRKCFASDTKKQKKTLCDNFQIIDSCIPLELPEIPELAAGRTETDVFPGVCVSSSVSQPYVVTSICYEIGCNTRYVKGLTDVLSSSAREEHRLRVTEGMILMTMNLIMGTFRRLLSGRSNRGVWKGRGVCCTLKR
jgi:hypothetical protein